MPFLLNKSFNNIKGLDLRVSDLLRQNGAATEAINVMLRTTGALSKRPGWQYKTLKATGGAGLHRFNNISISTGVITEELLCLDDNMHLYTENTFTVTYGGSNTAYYDLYFDTTDLVFYFDLYDDNTRVLHKDLGTGLGASDTTVDQLVTAINAITNFSCSVSGSPSTPAAFMPLGRSISLSASLSWFTWEQIDTPSSYSNPFTSHWAQRNSSTFELASFVESNDVLYISNGYDEMHKYDGNRVYRAGMKSGSAPVVADTAGATFSGGEVFKYKYLYEYTDAKENLITGDLTSEGTITKSGAGDINVTVQFLQNNTGFNTDQATVDGNQSGVNTITVLSGHNIKVNDQVYIYDGVGSSVVKRKVTAIAATTITIDGVAVNVSDTNKISCVKISLYRTKDGGQLYYFHSDLVNNSGTSSTTITDQTTDANLGAEIVEPVKGHGLPPKAKYMTLWRGQMVMTGIIDNVNNTQYSDVDGVEYYPTDNAFTLVSRLGGGNTGVAALDSTLFIFKPESIISVTGDLSNDSFRTDPFADGGIGCVSHHSIKEISGRLWFLGKKGVYSVDASNIKEESSAISPRFDNSYVEKKAIAFSWIDKDLYILSLTETLTASSEVYFDTNNTKILVYDFFNGAWSEWTNWNFMGGITEYDNKIFMQGRSLDVLSNAVNWTSRVMNQGTFDDYLDHNEAISFSFKSHWESLSDPSVFKKFNRIKVHSLDRSINDFEGDSFSLTIATEHDYIDSTVSSLSLDFSGGASGWGNSPWSSFPWGESRLAQLQSKLASKKAKSLRVIFTNSELSQNVLISGYELEVATPYDTMVKE